MSRPPPSLRYVVSPCGHELRNVNGLVHRSTTTGFTRHCHFAHCTPFLEVGLTVLNSVHCTAGPLKRSVMSRPPASPRYVVSLSDCELCIAIGLVHRSTITGFTRQSPFVHHKPFLEVGLTLLNSVHCTAGPSKRSAMSRPPASLRYVVSLSGHELRNVNGFVHRSTTLDSHVTLLSHTTHQC